MTINSFKRVAAIMLAMVMVLSMLPSIAFADDSDEVTINDENLRKAICEELGKTYSEGVDITEAEMEKLTKLDASNSGITDITGIKYAVNLTELNLAGNSFGYTFNGASDLSSLTKLLTLNLSNCSLGEGRDKIDGGSNYYGVSNKFITAANILTQLENLNLSGNGIYGTFKLCQYECNLKNVDLSNNYICELYLQGTYDQIEYIDLSNNCYYANEVSVGYANLVSIGLEKVNLDNQKNLSTLYATYFYGYNGATYTKYLADNENSTIDIGDCYADYITISIVGYTGRGMAEVTANDETFTVRSTSGDDSSNSATNFTVHDIAVGENNIKITVTHQNGDIFEYNLKVNRVELSNDVGITDPNLMKAVCSKLGKELTDNITVEEMSTITGSLSVSSASNLEGLQYATGLTSITATGTFTKVPDLSNITGLNSLTLRSNECDTFPESILELTNLSTISLALQKVTEFPDLSSLPLTSATIGYSTTYDEPSLTKLPKLNTSTLKTLTLYNLADVTDLPENVGESTALTTLTIYGGSISDFSLLNSLPDSSLTLNYYNQEVQMQGLTDNESIHTLYFSAAYNMGVDNYFKNLETISILSATDLTDVALDNFNPEMLAYLRITSSGIQKVPDNINEFKNLTTLMLYGNDFSNTTIDLSGLTNLEELYLNSTGLTSCPNLESLTNLTYLSLATNYITEFADLSILSKLTSLNISYNYLTEFPSWIKNLTELKTLNTYYNSYTDIPSDVFDNMTSLTTVYLGHLVKATGTSGTGAVPVEGTGLATAVSKLKENVSGAKVYIYSLYLSSLKEITTEYGTIEGILYPTRNGSSTAALDITVPEGTDELKITPTAFYDDSIITYDGVDYNSGDEITIKELHPGNNIITLTTYNEFTGTGSSNTVTYTISVVVGDYVETFEDGHVYYVPIKIYKQLSDNLSMAADYFEEYSTVRYNDGIFNVDLTTNSASMILSMQYLDSEGNYVYGSTVADDEETGFRTYRLIATTLDEALYIQPYVTPMGSTAICRVIFDTTKIIDITDQVGVDKSELYTAISSAKAIAEGNNIYTDETWAALTSALADAETVYAEETATDYQVNTALTSLSTALDSLTVDDSKIGDKTDLNSAIESASAIEQGDKTDSAWTALQEAITAAKEVSEKADAIQSEVDEALSALNTAVETFNNSESSSDLDKDNLADGVYTIYIEMYQTNRTSTSMTNNAVEHTAILEVIDGQYYVTLDFNGMTIGTSLGYLGSLSYFDSGYTYNTSGTPEGTLIDADVLTTQKDSDGNDIIDEYNSADSLYPDTVKIKLVDTALADEIGFVPLKVFVPIMEAISAGSGDQYVLMKIDWTSLVLYDDGSSSSSSDDNSSNSISSVNSESSIDNSTSSDNSDASTDNTSSTTSTNSTDTSTTSTGDNTSSTSTKTTASTSNPKSGDTMIAFGIVIMLVAAAVVIYKNRRRYE